MVVVCRVQIFDSLGAHRLGVSRRLAWGAVAVGVLGILLGWLATRSDVASLDQAFPDPQFDADRVLARLFALASTG